MGSFLQTLLGGGINDWTKGALVNVFNNQQAANQYGLARQQQYSGPLEGAANQNIGTGTNVLNSPDGGVSSTQEGAFQAANNVNPSQFTGGPAMSQLMALLGGPQSPFLQQTMANLGASGGVQNGLQGQGIQQSSSLLNGGSNEQQTLSGLGGTLSNAGGLTDILSRLQNTGANVVDNQGATDATNAGTSAATGLLGGMTPGLSALLNSGVSGLSGNLGTPGLTATGATGEQAALSGLQSGGQTNFTNSLQQIGQNYASQPALIPTGLAASMARDQAGANAKNAAQAVQAQAFARGGGPGAVVANGATNAGMADFADQIAQQQSKAYQDAITQQQGLNLQQQGQGAQMGLGAANTAAQQLGTYSSLLNSLEGTANQRYGISSNNISTANNDSQGNITAGLNGIASMLGAQTNSVGTFGNIANSASQQTTNRATAGASTLNDYINSLLQGGSLQNSQFGTTLQGLLGANSGFNTGLNTGGNLLQGAANTNLSGTNDFNNILNNFLGTQNSINNTGLNTTNSGMNALGNLAGQSYNYAGQGLAGQTNLFAGTGSNPGILPTLTNATAAATGAYKAGNP